MVWVHAAGVRNECALDQPIQPGKFPGIPKWWDFRDGTPRAHDFPSEAEFPMHAKWPKVRNKLSDNLTNSSGVTVVSERLATFLRDRKLKNVELIPVRVRNYKKALEPTQFFIVHPIHLPD